jgi:hypothetical protein
VRRANSNLASSTLLFVHRRWGRNATSSALAQRLSIHLLLAIRSIRSRSTPFKAQSSLNNKQSINQLFYYSHNSQQRGRCGAMRLQPGTGCPFCHNSAVLQLPHASQGLTDSTTRLQTNGQRQCLHDGLHFTTCGACCCARPVRRMKRQR